MLNFECQTKLIKKEKTLTMEENVDRKVFLMTTPFSILENSSKELTNDPVVPEDNSEIKIIEQNITDQTSMDFYQVEESKFIEFIATVVLIVGFSGNLFGICIFTCHPSGKKPMVLDKIVTFLCFTGLVTTIITTPLHIYAFKTRSFPTDTSLCQVQGLLLNLLCLISLWYTAVLATERFFRLVSPHEHRLTFSPMNINVILAGVFVLLVVEVSGPIYGWAAYGFLNDTTVCLLNPASNHIFTYSIIHVAGYVTLPIVITVGFTCYIIHHGLNGSEKLCNGSQVLKTGKGILVLCIGMLVTMVLLLPYYATLILQATFTPLGIHLKILVYWLHVIGITCVYPVVLATFGRKEVIPVFKLFLKEIGGYFSCLFYERGQTRDASSDFERNLTTMASSDERSKRRSAKGWEEKSLTSTTGFSTVRGEAPHKATSGAESPPSNQWPSTGGSK